MSKETPDEMMDRVQMMAEDSRGTWDLSENDQAALKHVLSLLHDVSTDADPAGTVRELAVAKETIKAQEVRLSELENPWIDIEERLPNTSDWVLAWLHLPKNPPASGHVLAQFTGCDEDEPEEYGEFRRTRGCWWANGRYYEKGHVTHWKPLSSPPVSRLKEERK